MTSPDQPLPDLAYSDLFRPASAPAAGIPGSPEHDTVTLAAVEDDHQTLQLPAIKDPDTVISLALAMGETYLAAGAAAADVVAVIAKVLSSYGVAAAAVDVTSSAITVSVTRPRSGAVDTQMRVVADRSTDYSRICGIADLMSRISAGRIDAHAAHRELEDILAAEHPYRARTSVASVALMASAVALLFGAAAAGAALAGAVGAAIYAMTRAMRSLHLPAFLGNVAGAAAATLAAAGVAALDIGVSPPVLIIAGVITLLAGMVFVGALTDALTGFHVTAAGRIIETTMLTGGVIAGASLGLQVAARSGVDLTATAAPANPSALLAVVAAAVAAAAYAHSAWAPKRTVPVVAAAGAIAQLVNLVAVHAGFGGAWGAAAAAAVVSFVAHRTSRLTRTPALLSCTAGLVPLLPGLAIYNGLFALAGEQSMRGILTLCTAATIAAALASGVLVGQLAAGRRSVTNAVHERRRPFSWRVRTKGRAA